MEALLKPLGVQSRIVDRKDHKCTRGFDATDEATYHHLSHSYAKLELLNQTDFSTLVFLECTVIVQKNIDVLFRVESPIAAIVKGRRACNWGGCERAGKGNCKLPMSTQVMVIKPDLQWFFDGMNLLNDKEKLNTTPKHISCKYGEKSFLSLFVQRMGGFECLDKTFNCLPLVVSEDRCSDPEVQSYLSESVSEAGIHVLNVGGTEPWNEVGLNKTKYMPAIWKELDCIRQRGDRCVSRHIAEIPSEERPLFRVWFRTLGEYMAEVPGAVHALTREIISRKDDADAGNRAAYYEGMRAHSSPYLVPIR